METVDERMVAAPLDTIFRLASEVEHWPALLDHYRYVRFRERTADGGGLVEMSANRPFGLLNWPTWWLSQMEVHPPSGGQPQVRFHHIKGVTREMDVAWTFETRGTGTFVRIVHVWDGPRWPIIGITAAQAVIGPVFVHGIASRTLEGLARHAEREAKGSSSPRSG
jgi:ribosome-associated toxin RatA of RatAB toxin-antitoxin module